MNYIKRNQLSILAFVSFIIIISIQLFWVRLDIQVFLGLFGSVATLYLVANKNKLEHDKLFKDLFNTFNERYDTEINDLLNTLKNKPDYDLKPEEINLVIDYLNLCAEEYLWRTRDRIPKEVWSSWKAGIIENLNIKQIKEIYNNETSTTNGIKSYYGLVKELQKQ